MALWLGIKAVGSFLLLVFLLITLFSSLIYLMEEGSIHLNIIAWVIVATALCYVGMNIMG